MSEPKWIDRRALDVLHGMSISEHGGIQGVRDEGALESGLNRPRNLFGYEGVTDIVRLAGSYAFGLAKNHPFSDGNKRSAFLALGVFLLINGLRLTADKIESVRMIFGLAASEIDEDTFTDWIRRNSRPK